MILDFLFVGGTCRLWIHFYQLANKFTKETILLHYINSSSFNFIENFINIKLCINSFIVILFLFIFKYSWSKSSFFKTWIILILENIYGWTFGSLPSPPITIVGCLLAWLFFSFLECHLDGNIFISLFLLFSSMKIEEHTLNNLTILVLLSSPHQITMIL